MLWLLLIYYSNTYMHCTSCPVSSVCVCRRSTLCIQVKVQSCIFKINDLGIYSVVIIALLNLMLTVNLLTMTKQPLR